MPRYVSFLIAVMVAWPALSQAVTRTVTYNGVKMEITGADNSIEIKDATGKIFVNGKWDSETDEFIGDVLGACPFAVRGTINHKGALMVFGQQPACDNEPAQWKTMRFIAPPERLQSIVRSQQVKKPKPKPRVARPQVYNPWQNWQWGWQRR